GREEEKVKLAIKILRPRRLAIFPTVLIHCLRQDFVTWQGELLNILSNEVFYHRMSCWYELGEALKLALPHASDDWVDNWIRTLESALPDNENNIARLKFFACCPEERLPPHIREELSDARSQGISLENKPLFYRGEFSIGDEPAIDLKTIDDVELREAIRTLLVIGNKSLDGPLSDVDVAKANHHILKILRVDFEPKRKHMEATTINQLIESKIIDPYNMALGRAAQLIRENQANEEVKQLAEQLAWRNLSREVPSYYQEEPKPDKYKGMPGGLFSNSIAVLAYLIRYEPTTKRCDKYLELVRHSNGDVRWTALLNLQSPKGKVEWYCDILKERAENEWLACCLALVCRGLCHLTQSQFKDTRDSSIEIIGILLARLTSGEQLNIQTPNECIKQLAEFFGSVVSAQDCPKEFYDWALACAQGEFGHDALISSISGIRKGLVRRTGEVAWDKIRTLYQTAIAHIEPQELVHASLWITGSLKDSKHPEMFEELLPVLKELAASTGGMFFSFSGDLKTHLRKHPVEYLEIFEIITLQERQKPTEDWDGSSLGIDSTAEVLQELDPFVPQTHRERLKKCIERLAELGNSTAQKHLLEFVL
ncbi:MAG: hypothetical protein H8D67_05425, partial [Deltaproteobacteria bacterium]|nr:hypothetical protein [Deltaproteobacteria bacterium]